MKSTIVILSGWAIDTKVWNGWEKLLKDYEVIIIDWQDVHSFDGFKEKVMSRIKREKFKDMILIGWSLGSLVAMDIAVCKDLSIQKIILISPSIRFVKDSFKKDSIGWDASIVDAMIDGLYNNPKKVLIKFYKKLFCKEEIKKGFDDKGLKKIEDNSNIVKSLITGLQYLRKQDVKENIKNIQQPVLIIHGKKDKICSIKHSEYIFKHLKKAQICLLPHAGHIPFLTYKQQCYEEIEKYIRKGSEL